MADCSADCRRHLRRYAGRRVFCLLSRILLVCEEDVPTKSLASTAALLCQSGDICNSSKYCVVSRHPCSVHCSAYWSWSTARSLLSRFCMVHGVLLFARTAAESWAGQTAELACRQQVGQIIACCNSHSRATIYDDIGHICWRDVSCSRATSVLETITQSVQCRRWQHNWERRRWIGCSRNRHRPGGCPVDP